MKVIGVIPARGGSKGILKKNKKLLNGRPLISYTIDAALNSKLDYIIVSTDDDEIRDISIESGVEVIMRPKRLSEDITPTLPVILHALECIKVEYDAVMTLQPTSPLRTSTHINDSIELFSLHPCADSLVSVVPTPHNFSTNSQMYLHDGWLKWDKSKNILRRQEKKMSYSRNGAAIYLTKTNKIHEYIYGGNLLAFVMNKIDSIDIDDMQDWQLAEAILTWKKTHL